MTAVVVSRDRMWTEFPRHVELSPIMESAPPHRLGARLRLRTGSAFGMPVSQWDASGQMRCTLDTVGLPLSASPGALHYEASLPAQSVDYEPTARDDPCAMMSAAAFWSF